MNFKEIIKQEWEKEFPLGVDDQPPLFGNSIFTMYEPMVEKICVRVWNQALELAADNAECDLVFHSEDDEANFERLICGIDYSIPVLKNSILKFKL